MLVAFLYEKANTVRSPTPDKDSLHFSWVSSEELSTSSTLKIQGIKLQDIQTAKILYFRGLPGALVNMKILIDFYSILSSQAPQL